VQLSDTLDSEKWNDLMVEESLKSVYFKVLQTLRVITERINESMEDLAKLKLISATLQFCRECGDISDDDLIRFNKNTDTLIAIIEGRRKKLLDRIERKRQEVESLQAGV